MTIAIRPAPHAPSSLAAVRRLLAPLLRVLRPDAASADARAHAHGRAHDQGADAATRANAAAHDGPVGGAAAARTYLVRHGDTAASIAIAHGLSAASLLVRNGMRLRDEPTPGTVLNVERGARGCRAATADVPVDVRHHTVAEGDTLEKLCAAYRIAPRILLTANGLASASCLTPGVTIAVPTSTNPLDTGEIPVIRAAGSGVSADLS